MDRRTRSTFTRCRVAGTLALALGLAGCNGNASYVITGATSGSAAGVPVGTTGYVQASTSSSSAAFAAVFLLHWSLLNQQWDRGAGMYGSSTLPAPPMDETRTVNVQDCTKPIEDWSANLRCR